MSEKPPKPAKKPKVAKSFKDAVILFKKGKAFVLDEGILLLEFPGSWLRPIQIRKPEFYDDKGDQPNRGFVYLCRCQVEGRIHEMHI
jgi:hypothetical protein